MNTYVGITKTGVVIIKANTLREAAEKFTDAHHVVHTVHIIPSHKIDIWSYGREGENFRIHHLN